MRITLADEAKAMHSMSMSNAAKVGSKVDVVTRDDRAGTIVAVEGDRFLVEMPAQPRYTEEEHGYDMHPQPAEKSWFAISDLDVVSA